MTQSLTISRYCQAHKPIAEQESIEGHSVRAMYLLTAVADLVRQDGPEQQVKLNEAVHRLWNSMVQRKMQVPFLAQAGAL